MQIGGWSGVSRWFGSVDMDEAFPAAVAVVAGLERLLEETQPSLVQPARSWIRSRCRGWPPPELVWPDTSPSAEPDWPDCEVGIRLGHATDAEADITVGVGPRGAVVGCLDGWMSVSLMDRSWIDEVVNLTDNALRAQYVWEEHYRGRKCVRSELAYVGVSVDGTQGRHVKQAFQARTAWWHLPHQARVERRVVTYGLHNHDR